MTAPSTIALRVAFVLPSFAGGGAERVSLLFAGTLDRERFEPVIVVLDGQGALRNAVPDGIAVHDLGCRRVRYAFPAMAARLRRVQAQAIVPTMGYLNLAVLALRPLLRPGTRIFPREANLPSKTIAALPVPRLARLACAYLYPRADGVLCNSLAVADELRTVCRVPPACVHRLDNPVDVESIRRAAATPERRPGAGPRFVAAGRLTHQKGFDRLIDIFAEAASDAQLTILGDGPDRSALIHRAAELGLGDRVHLPGFASSPWPHYAGADAFLLPSRWEGMPNAALEALACGTPVIAVPEAGGIGEVASEVGSKAVRVAPWGRDFLDAMSTVEPSACHRPRPSLLPQRYELREATSKLAALLES